MGHVTLGAYVAQAVTLKAVFSTDKAIRFQQSDFGIVLKIPKENRNDIDTIVELVTAP